MFSPAWFDFTWYFDQVIDNLNAKNAVQIILCYYNFNPEDERYWTSQIAQEEISNRIACTRQTVKVQLERASTLEFPCPFCTESQTGIIGIGLRGKSKSYDVTPLLNWLLHLQEHYEGLTEEEFVYYRDKFLVSYKPKPTEAQREARRQNITKWHIEEGHIMRDPEQEPAFGPTKDTDGWD